MEYVMAEVSFMGNDDVDFAGFTARKVESLEAWKSQVEEQVNESFEDSSYMEIYHSDNCSTPFESADEVLGNVSFKKITEEEFKLLKKLFGGKDKVQYGNDVSFLEYEALVVEAKKTSRKKM